MELCNPTDLLLGLTVGAVSATFAWLFGFFILIRCGSVKLISGKGTCKASGPLREGKMLSNIKPARPNVPRPNGPPRGVGKRSV